MKWLSVQIVIRFILSIEKNISKFDSFKKGIIIKYLPLSTHVSFPYDSIHILIKTTYQ